MENKKRTTKCNQCGRRVRDDFQGKWNHIVKRHPELMVSRFLPILGSPETAYTFGEMLGQTIKRMVM